MLRYSRTLINLNSPCVQNPSQRSLRGSRKGSPRLDANQFGILQREHPQAEAVANLAHRGDSLPCAQEAEPVPALDRKPEVNSSAAFP